MSDAKNWPGCRLNCGRPSDFSTRSQFLNQNLKHQEKVREQKMHRRMIFCHKNLAQFFDEYS